MSSNDDQVSDTLSLIDQLAVLETTNNNDNTNEARDILLAKLYAQLNSLEDSLQILSTFDQLEQCFIKLTRLTSIPFISTSPVFIGCCLLIIGKINELSFLMGIGSNKVNADEYYTLSLDALTIKENLDYLQDDHNIAADLYETYTRWYLFIAREAIKVRNRTLESLSIQQYKLHTSLLEEKYKPFIKLLLSFIDRKLNTDKDLSCEIGFFVSLADNTNMVPDLIECELPQHLNTWLTIYNNKKQIEKIDLCELILVIINNVARHKEGSNILKDFHMNELLKTFWKLYENHLSDDYRAFYYMTYALIVTPDELKSTNVLHDVIDYLMDGINIASCSSDMRNHMAHISEYLVALARLVVNDNVAQYIINTCKIDEGTDGLSFFHELFMKHNDLTSDDLYTKHLSRITLFNIFCSFSFQTTAHKSLTSNKKFIEIIKNASRQNNEQDVIIQPDLLQHLLSVKQASEAILINLDLYKDKDAIQVNPSSEIKLPRVMISYSHKDRIFCRDVVRSLKSNSIDLWVDEDGHCRSDDCWEEIAVAIKNASFILVIVSSHYCESIACRKEATYADKKKKTLIALYPNGDKYEPDEWLDIRLTGTYVRFGGSDKKKSFDESISRLLDFIRPKQENVTHSVVPKSVSLVLSTPTLEKSYAVPISKTDRVEFVPSDGSQSITITKSSIHDWTKQDVERWFLVERNLLPELYKLYSFVDGDSLLEYAKHFIQEHDQDANQQYEKLHKRLQNQFGIEFYDNNYTDLVCSMKKVLSTYDPQSLSMSQTKKQKSSMCSIL